MYHPTFPPYSTTKRLMNQTEFVNELIMKVSRFFIIENVFTSVIRGHTGLYTESSDPIPFVLEMIRGDVGGT